MIMLTNTANEEIFRMTQNALTTLSQSLGSENFNVVLDCATNLVVHTSNGDSD